MSVFDDWDVADWAGGNEATDVRVRDGVLALTLNRPSAANARNQRMREELKRTYRELAGRDDVKVVVLRAAGDKFFCAGMDLKEAGAADETVLEARRRLGTERDIELLADLRQPTIAAVNGYALGGGLEMAMACDLRVVAAEASVGLTEVDHGLVPGGGGTVRLARLVGEGLALEMILLAKRIDGSTAASVGLANRCVPRAELDSVVLELAAAVAAKPANATRAAKALVRHAPDLPLGAALDRELDTLLALMEHQRSRGV